MFFVRFFLQGEDFSFRASFVVTSFRCPGDVRSELVLGALGSWDVLQVRAAGPFLCIQGIFGDRAELLFFPWDFEAT